MFIGPIDERRNLHDVIEINGNTIRMTYWPDDLIIGPR